VREAIFDVLMHHPTHGCDLSGDPRVLDLFAGSGGLGIEALSRGGAKAEAHFVERDRSALQVLRRNLKDLDLGERTTVWPLEARRAVERLGDAGVRFDVLLLDPPYADTEATTQILRALTEARVPAPGAILVLERAATKNDDVPDVAGLCAPLVRRWGDTEALFYRID
jgi:16S rRNA (guanine966-N2)-methyltransferase